VAFQAHLPVILSKSDFRGRCHINSKFHPHLYHLFSKILTFIGIFHRKTSFCLVAGHHVYKKQTEPVFQGKK